MISLGQRLLADYMKALTGKEPVMDARPGWLDMEIDIWYEDFDLAIEFQGHQHFAPVYGRKIFRKQVAGDKLKLLRCEARGIVLIRVQICELKHPQLTDILLGRFIQCYGKEAGAARFFKIAGENPISRPALFHFNNRFRAYREGQIIAHGAKSAVSNSQERRLLKRAIKRRAVG